MEIQLYFHIGDSKTGTSLIQNFLNINRGMLIKEHRCLYPNISNVSYTRGRCHNHCAWFHKYIDKPEVLGSDLDKLLRFSRQKKIQKVVMSCEGWSTQSPKLADVVANVLEKHQDVSVHPVLYVRRPDLWVESAWKQWGLKTDQTLESYTENHLKNPRYVILLRSLKAWGTVTRHENITVRPYEKGQLVEGLINDFLRVIGIDPSGSHWNEPEDTNMARNTGFNPDVVEVLHLCRGLVINMHDNQLNNLFFNLLGETYQKQPYESYHALPPATRLKIIQENKAEMREIARNYMGREDGTIFFEPMPSEDEDWRPYEGLTLEKFVPIVIKMIATQQKRIENQKKYSPDVFIKRFLRNKLGK
jgi:hypothetical protein